MTLANGHAYLAIPGPSVVPDRIQRVMHRTAPNIYEGELHALAGSLWPDLRALRVIQEEDWDRLTQGSPVRRAGLEGLRRNAAKNLGDG